MQQQATDEQPTLFDIVAFIAPQLLEHELRGEARVHLLHGALHYPERMRAHCRYEFGIESRHFKEGHFSQYGHEFVEPVLADLRDDILAKVQVGELSRENAVRHLLRAGQFGSETLFYAAAEALYPLSAED